MSNNSIDSPYPHHKLLVLTLPLALDRNCYYQLKQWDVKCVAVEQLLAREQYASELVNEFEPNCLIIESDDENLTRQLLSLFKNSLCEFIPKVLMLVNEPTLPTGLIKKYDMDQVLAWPIDPSSLSLQLQWAQVHAQDREKTKKRIKVKSSTAKVAMESASELGIVLRMFETVLKAKNYQELSQQLQHLFGQFHLDVVLLIPQENTPDFFPIDVSEKIKEILIQAYNSDQRILSNERFMLMRTEFLVLMITNAPWHDEIKYGRYRDLLAHVVTLAQAKIKHLLINQIVDQQHVGIQKVLTMVRQQTVNYHDRTIELMQNLSHELEVAAISLDLHETQENHILSLAEQAISSVSDLSDFNVVIESHFENLLQTYQGVIELSLSPPSDSREEDNEEVQLF